MSAGLARPVRAAEPIKIGILTCLTGPIGFIGQPIKEAFTAIFDDLNQKGGINGRKVELLIEDDQSNPSNAVISATKLIKDEKVPLIIGSSTADSDAAIIPTVEQEQVPMLVAGPLVAPFKKDDLSHGPRRCPWCSAHHGVCLHEAQREEDRHPEGHRNLRFRRVQVLPSGGQEVPRRLDHN